MAMNSQYTKLHLFDSIILPILTHGCEVWGHEIFEPIEIFFRNFLPTLLNVRNSTPKAMIYGELGRSEMKKKSNLASNFGFSEKVERRQKTRHQCSST